MKPATILLLALSSLLNVAIAAGAFLFQVFATNPAMADMTMRVGHYVLYAVLLAALAGTILPWILAAKRHPQGAIICAALPALLACLAVLAFLTLDSSLRRTFDG